MTGDPFKPVSTGSPATPNARWHNAVTEATLAYQRNKAQVSGGPAPIRSPEGLVYARNDSGQDLNRFDVVGIKGTLYGPPDMVAVQNGDPDALALLAEFQNNTAITVELAVPGITDYHGMFGICYEPIADGAIGRVCISGMMPVLIQVFTPSDQFADYDNGTTLISQAVATLGCAEILNELAPIVGSAPNPQWCFVRFPVGGETKYPIFPVNVFVDGGADAVTPADMPTYTYSVYLYGEIPGPTTLLASGVSPSQQRPTGSTLPAVIGLAFFDWHFSLPTVNGNLILQWCDESPAAWGGVTGSFQTGDIPPMTVTVVDGKITSIA